MKYRYFATLLALFFSARVFAGGFAEHLIEAMQSNRQRMQGYSRLTGGQSRTLSQAWIGIGAGGLPMAWYLDQRAKRFQRAGIPVMQLDFISMRLAPDFSDELLPVIPDSVAYPQFPRRRWRDRILELSAARDFGRLHQEALGWVKEMEALPRFNVLLRHMIESTARIAYLAPQYEAMAISRNVGMSSIPLSQWLLYVHAKGLWAGAWLDAWAEPMQRRGVPILMRDIPPVDMSPQVNGLVSEDCPEQFHRRGTGR